MGITRTIQPPKYNRRADEGLPGKGYTFSPLFGWTPEASSPNLAVEEVVVMDIKQVIDIVKGKRAKFVEFKNKEFWYEIPESNFSFPIPLEDTDGGVFQVEEDASLLKRWVRKHLELLEEAKK
jgi:hypothetical protein